MDRSSIETVQPEWEVHPQRVQEPLGREPPSEPLALRAGHGIIALIHHRPAMGWVFMHQLPKYPAGGPFSRRPEMAPPVEFPVDLVGVTPPGKAWMLEPARGRVSSDDIGGYITVLGMLGTQHRVRRGCLLSERRLAYLDDTRPHEIFIRDFDAADRTDTLPFPAEWIGNDSASWATLRFGGATVGRCVLWAPGMEVVLRVSDSGTVPIGPLIEPPTPQPRRAALLGWLRRDARPPLVGDATTFPGGVAVLMAGSGALARRVIDFYREDGRFMKAVALARPALRIAGSDRRLYALSWHHDSVFLASYYLPNVETPDEEPMPYVPPPPRGVRTADSADTGTGRR